VSAAKQRGTAWESAVVAFLRERGWPNAERRALNGRADRGDIAGVIGVVVEAKNARTVDLAGWLREAQAEALNDRARHGVVWFKRRGKASAGDGYVLMDGETFVALLVEAGYQ
jgi:hypothetical protein